MKTLSVQILKLFSLLSLLLICSGRLYAQVDYYDIYVFDLKKGTTQQVTSIPNAGEYNCSWSQNNKKIVSESVTHDAITDIWHQKIYVTDVGSGVSTLLTGGDGGNDASWSPNGQNILFDADGYYIYSVPATGGEPVLLREAGMMADWSPNSQSIVFFDWNTYCIKTMSLKDGSETSVVFGAENPVWSPNGQYIAYDEWYCCGGIWIIKIDLSGNPIGDPIQLTTSGSQPSWSNNSKTIVYSDATVIDEDNTDPGDIYSIPVTGGTPQRVCGRVDTEYGDYDPCYSNNGQYIAFSSATNPPKSKLAVAPGNSPFEKGLQVNVYGNPSKSNFRLNLQSKSTQTLSIRIMDSKGRIVYNSTGIQPNTFLNIGDNFRQGVYFAEIRQGMQRKVIKLLKQ